MAVEPRQPTIAMCGAVLLLALAVTLGVGTAADARAIPIASGAASSAPGNSEQLASRGWAWPAAPSRLARPFLAPAHEYGPGHRGMDLDLLGGTAVRAPADGVVAFAGSVAGRGILTIDHGGGLVTTLEPVETSLVPGVRVQREEQVAALGLGGHTRAGALHFGVRLNGDYINPMLLLGGVPRAVLLPCCDES